MQLELPITIVHINSLDVIPSSVGAVSKMIALYTGADPSPVSPRSAKPRSSTSRRTSLASNFGNIVLDEADEGCESPVNGANFRSVVDSSPRRSSYSSSRNLARRSLPAVDISGVPTIDITASKPGIQCDLRRALSLDYQNRYSKLDISAENAGYTHGAILAKRSPDRKRRDLSENLAHRLHRERTKNINFYDVI